MKFIAALLLFGVFARHDTAYWLNDLTGMHPVTVFYMMGGFWEVILCSVVISLLLTQKNGFYRHIAILAMGMGILEGFQIGICSILAQGRMPFVPKGQNVCDFISGVPIGATMVGLYILVVCYFVGRKQ